VTLPNALAGRIEDTLKPIIGSVLASVSVDLETRRIGKSPETVAHEDLPVLAENLVGQLRLVVGKDLAEAAAARVRGIG
jgi:hypothetical protein